MASQRFLHMLKFTLPPVGLGLATWIWNRSSSDGQEVFLPEEIVQPETRFSEHSEGTSSTTLQVTPSAIRQELGLSVAVSSSKNCPNINRPSPRLLNTLVRNLGSNQSAIISDSNSFYHFYVYIEKGPTYEELARSTGLPKGKALRLLQNPYLFPFMFCCSMIGGGARVQPRESRKSIGMELTPARDPIEMSQVSMDVYVPSHVPVPQAFPGSNIAFSASMLAQTRYGHALTGSVLHVLFGDEERVYFVWIGAGGGLPIIGGGLNNVLALNAQTGVWPMLSRNYRGFLEHPKVMDITSRLLDEKESSTSRRKMVEAIQGAARKNEGWQPYLSGLSAFLPDLFGQRLGSSLYGWERGKKGQIKGE